MNVKRVLSFIISIVLCMAAFGCAKVDDTVIPSDNNETESAYINRQGESVAIALHSLGATHGVGAITDSYSQSDNTFAVSVINALDEDWSGVISPLSIRVALQLAANGGDADTMNAIMSVICPGQTRDDINSNAYALMSMLNSSRSIGLSSAVIADDELQINSSYAELVADYYRAAVGTVDFSNPEKALEDINNWISSSTNGLIPELFKEISSNTCVVLASSLTLDLDWETPFQSYRELSDFNGVNGVQQIGMITSNSKYAYNQFDCGQMAIIPYNGGEYAMALILPEKGCTPQYAASQLIGRWDECVEAPGYISMPKLNISTTTDFMSMLERLGLEDAMNGNFTALVNGGATIGQILQGATLTMSESGTTAAAASAVTVEKGLYAPAFYMECNRPYATVIYHIETGTVLFVSITNNVG